MNTNTSVHTLDFSAADAATKQGVGSVMNIFFFTAIVVVGILIIVSRFIKKR